MSCAIQQSPRLLYREQRAWDLWPVGRLEEWLELVSWQRWH